MTPLGTYLLQTFATLLVVVAAAVAVLWAARRMGLGRVAGPMHLVGRLPLDGRRVLYLVRVADRVLIVGASEGGLTKLGELDGEQVVGESQAQQGPSSFAQLWRQVRQARAKVPDPEADSEAHP